MLKFSVSNSLAINMHIISQKWSLMKTLYTYLTKIIIKLNSNVGFYNQAHILQVFVCRWSGWFGTNRKQPRIMTAPQLWALKCTLVQDTAQDRQRSLAGKFPFHVHMHKQCRFRGLGQTGETRKRSPIKAHRSRDVWLTVCCLVWQ